MALIGLDNEIGQDRDRQTRMNRKLYNPSRTIQEQTNKQMIIMKWDDIDRIG